MPYRKTLLVSEEIYHVFNRSVAQLPIFLAKSDYYRALDLINFYRFKDTSIRFSYYNRLRFKQKGDFLFSLYSTEKLVQIYAFCLMPNHFHLLVKQLTKDGITKFLRLFENSYARYLNIKEKRCGAVFQAMFKAIRVESQEQLLHVFRYINLNPVTSYILKSVDNLNTYPWASYVDYVSKNQIHDFMDTEFIKSNFKNSSDLANFLCDQVNYQRTLNRIKHLLVE